jgi:nucleotide-binding universal stress UspA family protein
MTKLVVLLDGSVYAESVCDHTAWLATRMNASVELIHILDNRVPMSERNLSGNIGVGARSALLSELAENEAQNAKLAQKRGRAILEDGESRLRDAGVDRIETKLRSAPIVNALTELEADADMVVLGKRGEAADFAKLDIGPNVEKVVRASHRPLLVTSRAFKPIEKVLIAFDGGASVLKAIAHIAARGEEFTGLDFRLLSVGAETSAMRGKIDAAAEKLRAAGYRADAYIEAGEPDEVIGAQADAGEADMLVMGAYSHSRIRNLIIGSTTTEMIRRCKIPVMLFR